MVIVSYGPRPSEDFKRKVFFKSFLLDRGYIQSDLVVVYLWHWNESSNLICKSNLLEFFWVTSLYSLLHSLSLLQAATQDQSLTVYNIQHLIYKWGLVKAVELTAL